MKNTNARVIALDTDHDVVQAFKALHVDEEAMPKMADKAALIPVRLDNVKGASARILKNVACAVAGDAAISGAAFNGSNEVTDVVLMGTLRQYRRMAWLIADQHPSCRALMDDIMETVTAYTAPKTCTIGATSFDFSKKTAIMGILNVTPDSFYDGGVHEGADGALAHAQRMVDAGADIIDIGGESTRPGAAPVSEKEELRRTVPVIRQLAESLDVPLSIDTTKPGVARAALDAGAALVNDVNGLRTPGMAGVVGEYGVPVVIMHREGTPQTMQNAPRYEDVVGEICAFFRERIAYATSHGIARSAIILDPGIGFGKTAEHNLAIIRALPTFSSLGCPVLLGASRKSFLGAVLGDAADDRLTGSLAVAAYGAAHGAHIIRVHDVAETVKTCRIIDAMK